MTGQDWVFGLHPVAAALSNRPQDIREIWLDFQRRDARIRTLLENAERQGIPVQRKSRDELTRLSGRVRHQGVAARLAAGVLAIYKEADLLARLTNGQDSALLLVLDGVQDPHNLGACLRSADAAGVLAVIAPMDRAAGLTATVRKVACGAADTVPFVQVTNLAHTLRRFQEQGLWLVGAAGDADTTLYEVDLTGPVAIVLGAEEKGLRRLTRETCDYLARIPMSGKVESLNVSVAAGIFLFEAVRQRTTICTGG